MAKSPIEMDLEEWDFVHDHGFLNLGQESGKRMFDPKRVVDMNCFFCTSQPSSKNEQVSAPIGWEPIEEKNPDEIKEIDVVPLVQIPLRNFKEKESRMIGGFEEKDEDSGDQGEVEKEEYMAGSEIKGKPCCKGFCLRIWKWRLTGIGALCSVGVAAATMCIFMFGGRQEQQNQKIQFQIYADDHKRIVVQHATSLNQALSAMRGVPTTGAHISFGGYFDGL